MKLFKSFSPAILVLGAVCVFSGHATTTAEAKRFTPTSFLPKKTVRQLNNNNVGNNNFPESASAIATRGGNAFGDKVKDLEASLEIKFSYWLDVACTIALTGFMYFWWKSIDKHTATPPSYPYFAKSVLQNGFCNKDFGKAGTEFLTQKLCGIVDFIMVGLSYLLAKSQGKDKSPIFMGSAIYTLVHGAVHYSVFLDPTVSAGPVDAVALAILAVVLVFCPLGLYTVLNAAPSTKDKGLALPVSALAWAACVAAYGAVFKMKEYALTYINVTTFMLFFGSRALLVGTKTPEEIEARKQLNSMFPNFWIGSIATIAVVFIMCSEPTACNGWFGNAGGHVLFEFALYAYLLSTTFP